MNQSSIFQQRLDRVSRQKGHTLATLHVGMDQQLPNGMMLRAKLVGRERERAGRVMRHLHLGLAGLSGVLAWIWAHWMRVTVSPFELPVAPFAVDLMLALVALGTLRAVFALRGGFSLALQLLGLLVGILALQALVPLAPQTFATIFSAEWVQAQLQASTSVSELLGLSPIL